MNTMINNAVLEAEERVASIFPVTNVRFHTKGAPMMLREKIEQELHLAFTHGGRYQKYNRGEAADRILATVRETMLSNRVDEERRDEMSRLFDENGNRITPGIGTHLRNHRND